MFSPGSDKLARVLLKRGRVSGFEKPGTEPDRITIWCRDPRHGIAIAFMHDGDADGIRRDDT
jgi:hypothetical protein